MWRGDDLPANGLRHPGRDHGADKVQKSRHHDRYLGTECARRHTSRDSIGRIVEAIDKIKAECQNDNKPHKVHIRHIS